MLLSFYPCTYIFICQGCKKGPFELIFVGTDSFFLVKICVLLLLGTNFFVDMDYKYWVMHITCFVKMSMSPCWTHVGRSGRIPKLFYIIFFIENCHSKVMHSQEILLLILLTFGCLNYHMHRLSTNIPKINICMPTRA